MAIAMPQRRLGRTDMEPTHIIPSPTTDRDDPIDATVYVAGTGSYAAEIVEFAQACGFEVPALIELINPERVGNTVHGLPVIAANELPFVGARATLATGSNRMETWALLAKNGWLAATVVHPSAYVSVSATIAAGCIVGPACVLGAQTTLAEHVLLGRGALVGHHVTVGAGAALNPGANIAGNVTIGAGAIVGMGAIVVNGLTVGERAIIAGGAVVVRDVADDTRVQGVRAREYTQTNAL